MIAAFGERFAWRINSLCWIARLDPWLLGGDCELIDLGGGHVVAVAHRFVYY